MKPITRILLTLGLLPSLCTANGSAQESAGNRYTYRDDVVRVNFTTRTPEQIFAFYYARGFPDTMLQELKKYCFVTIGIGNRTQQVILHDLGKWKFISAGGEEITPLLLPHWRRAWADLQAPMAAQSTFRWTMMPITLDFQPNEAEGGNVVLPAQGKKFRIHAVFELADSSKTLSVVSDLLQCEGKP